MTDDPMWERLRREADACLRREPALRDLLEEVILKRGGLAEALSVRMSRKLAYHSTPEGFLKETFEHAFAADPDILQAVRNDIEAVLERDPACRNCLTPMLFFKGFQALTCHRVAHYLWSHEREELAFYLQSLVSEVLAVDIHPAARLGSGILLDHATGFVAGETSVVEDNVSILHEVTLGGTGKQKGDRHPKVRQGVLIGAGAKLLGNIEIGEGARIGAGSVVLSNVPAHCTAVGVPAEVVGPCRDDAPYRGMDHTIN